MIEDKVVAITGASSGIGEATALACAKAGARVALAARRADRIEALAERIRADGGQAVAIETDVADEASARAFGEGARRDGRGAHGRRATPDEPPSRAGGRRDDRPGR